MRNSTENGSEYPGAEEEERVGQSAMPARTGAIVLAAGRGSRMNSAVPKQYLRIGGKELIYYSLKAFQDFSPVLQVILVTGPGETEECRTRIVDRYGLTKVVRIIPGGRRRQDSVFEALKAAGDLGWDYVMIHDGARPMIDGALLWRNLEGAWRHGACVCGMPVKDTIKLATPEGRVEETPDRSRLWQVQTPQSFRYQLIWEAYQEMEHRKLEGITDDAMVLERTGSHPVYLTEGSYRNNKVTTPEDLVWAEAWLK